MGRAGRADLGPARRREGPGRPRVPRILGCGPRQAGWLPGEGGPPEGGRPLPGALVLRVAGAGRQAAAGGPGRAHVPRGRRQGDEPEREAAGRSLQAVSDHVRIAGRVTRRRRAARPALRQRSALASQALHAIGVLRLPGHRATGPLLPEFQRALGARRRRSIGIVVAAFGIARLCVDLPVRARWRRGSGFRPVRSWRRPARWRPPGRRSAAGMAGLVLAQILAGVGCVLCHVTAWSSSARSGPRRALRTDHGPLLRRDLRRASRSAARWQGRSLPRSAGGPPSRGRGGGSALRARADPGRPRPGVGAGARAACGLAGALGRRARAPAWCRVYLLHFTALFLWAGVRTAVWPSLASEAAAVGARDRTGARRRGPSMTLFTLASAGQAPATGWGKVPVITSASWSSVVGLAGPGAGHRACWLC